MAYDIIIGRDNADKERFGNHGLIFLGKGYVKMGTHTSLSNNIWMDIARSHAILIAGKRGSGKSYTLGAIAEALTNVPAENAKNIASIIFDTMGIFWTMKYKNEKDALLLKEWNLQPKNLPVKVFIPYGKKEEYIQKRIPFDNTFALKASELGIQDWITLFNLEMSSPFAVIITRAITQMKGKTYTLKDMKAIVEKDTKAEKGAKETVVSFFDAAQAWGVFSETEEGTSMHDLITPGTTTVLDISVYSSASAFNIRATVISLITRALFKARMDARKVEEVDSILQGQEYLSYAGARKEPLVWMFIDEAHEFLPKDAKTPATDALIQILREGRQPGLSLVLATQQPGQIHRDVMTQSDIVISHRVTSKTDVEALNEIMQTYLLQDIQQQMDNLPALKGSAIVLDDNSERLYPMRVRPKFTWHGGEAPASISAKLQI